MTGLVSPDPASVEAALAAEDGWSELPSYGGPTGGALFVPGSLDDDRLCLRCFTRERDGRTVGKAWFGRGSEGPPGHVHGGALMAVADHVSGVAVWLAGYPSFTARFEYDFRSMVPVGTVIAAEAWVDSIDGRKVRAQGRLLSREGHLLGESTALFLRMERHHVERVVAHLGPPDP